MQLSVIVPVYNVAPYLNACLDSISEAVRGLQAEVLLVDDGSTDDSGEIARQYAKRNGAFVYHREQNMGVGGARNTGAALARGKYLAFADSDDLVLPDIYRNMLAAAERNDSQMVSCGVARLEDNKVNGSVLHSAATYRLPGINTHIRDWPMLAFDSTAWNKLILRDYYRSYGFQFPPGKYFEDLPVTVPMHYWANKVTVVRSTGYLWRLRPMDDKSITQRSTEEKNLDDKIEMITRLLQFCDEVREPSIRRAVELKALWLDFERHIADLQNLPVEQAMRFLGKLRSFSREQLDMAQVQALDLYHRQMWAYVEQMDLEALIPLSNYKKTNYKYAPVVQDEGKPLLQVPGKLFTLSDRDASREYRLVLPRHHIDAVRKERQKLQLNAHIYYNRFSCPVSDGQHFQAYLYNEISGQRIPLPTRAIPCHSLTLEKGTVINADDNRQYRYNYDGAGYQIEIDWSSLPLHADFLGSNLIQVEFKTNVDSGTIYLTGISSEKARRLQYSLVECGPYQVELSFDRRKMLRLYVEPRGLMRAVKRRLRLHRWSS